MSRESVEQLLDRWNTDAQFRDDLRHDPEGTVRAIAAELDDDEWQALREVDWSASDEELGTRASKMY